MSDLQILRPFGPSIVKLSIPDDLVKKLNDYTDRIILDEEKITKLDHSNQLAGKVKQEFLLENEFMQEIKWGEFLAKGVKLTDQRRIIAKVMSESSDHPDVDELYNRVSKIDPKISIATVYRTVKLFEESGILTKHDFKGGKARYEALVESHHDHLIDIKSGEIIEFVDEEIEKLQKKVAEKYGYKLVDHKLELYGVKKK